MKFKHIPVQMKKARNRKRRAAGSAHHETGLLEKRALRRKTRSSRRKSATFGQWVGEYLSEESHRMMWIPPGFAHGFLVTSDIADFQYKCTDFYAPEDECAVHWADKELAIDWPIRADDNPIVSPKDENATLFSSTTNARQRGIS